MNTLLRILYPEFVGGRAAVGFLAVRVVAGSAFMIHGWGKIRTPFTWMGPDATIPGFFQALAALSEFGGGLAWVLGALTPMASFGLLCTMTVATWMHSVVRGDPFVSTGGMSYEPALVYWTVALLMILAGPGRLSVDDWLFGSRRRGTAGTRA